MTFINVQIKHNGTDISEYFLSYHRAQEMCSSTGTLELIVIDSGRVYSPWDTIIIYEDGTKKGTYFISTTKASEKDGTMTISAQDGSKKLIDYFISDSYTVDYLSYTGDWIEQFLTEAGLTYSNFGGQGVPLSENTSLGLSSAYDQIMTLLQYSGWYMYFDENNTAIIGDLTIGSGNPARLDDSEILSVYTNKSDKMLRNRAVVWGNYDTITEEQVIADLSVRTPWNYDANDLRAVVIANSAIRTQTDAETLARKILTEFARINFEITIEVAGALNIDLGGIAYVSSMGYRGSGLITTIDVACSKAGLVTTLILNQRCPRLFGFWGDYDDYVYIGTISSGVWRKPLDAGDWGDFSTSLPSGTGITDLYINNSILATTTVSGELYYRDIDTNWLPFIPSGIFDESDVEYPASGLFAKCVTMNHSSNNIIAGYNTLVSGEDGRCWVIELDDWGNQLRADQVYVASGIDIDYNVTIIDLDTNDVSNIVSVIASGAGGQSIVIDDDLGYRTNYFTHTQSNSVTYLPVPLFGDLDVESGDEYLDLSDATNTLGITAHAYGNVITQNKLNRDYSYMLYRYSSGSTNVKARRTRFITTWNAGLGEYEITTDVDEVIISGITTTSYLYKEEGNDDVLYILNLIYGSQWERYEVNFATSSYSSSILVTEDTNVTGTPRGRYLYLLYKTKSVGINYTIEYSYDKLDFLSNTVENISIGTLTFTGYNSIYHSSKYPVLSPKTNDGFIFFEWYAAGTASSTNSDQVGLIYGDETGIHKDIEWTRPGGNNDLFSIPDMTIGSDPTWISRFAGDFTSITNLLGAFGYQFNEHDFPYDFISGKIIRIHMDNNCIPDIVSETFVAGEYIEYTNYYNSDSIPKAPFYSMSSRYLSTGYFLTGGGTGDLKIITIPDCTLHATINPADSGYYLFNAFGNCLDDVTDTIYVRSRELVNSTSEKLIGISINGEIVAKYPDIITKYRVAYWRDSEFSTSNSFWVLREWDFSGGNNRIVTDVVFIFPLYPDYERPAGCTILKQDLDIFVPILTVDGEYHVEISKNNPTECYHVTTSGETTYYPIYQSFSNGVDDFDTITTTFPIYDGRVFDIITPSGFMLASGIMEDTNWRYFGVAMDEGLKAFPVTLSGNSIMIENFSGGITHLETSNYGDNPYIFVSNSGFYQRDPTSTTFIDYSANLPDSDITIIRLDDLL